MKELPMSPRTGHIRDIRNEHLNQLINISGVVTRRSGVFPQLKITHFDCMACMSTFGPFVQNQEREFRPNRCPQCQSKGGFQVNAERTIYRNYQKITLQEAPGSVPAGRLPRHKDVALLGDLIDKVRPGQKIEVTGNLPAAVKPRCFFSRAAAAPARLLPAAHCWSRHLHEQIRRVSQHEERLSRILHPYRGQPHLEQRRRKSPTLHQRR